MLHVAEHEETIARPAEEVFAWVADFSHYAEWFPGVECMNAVDDRPIGAPGKRYAEVARVPFKGEQSIGVVLRHCEPQRLIRFEADLAPLLPRFTLRFSEPVPGQTRVHWLCESRNSSMFFRLLAAPWARRVLQRRCEQALVNLKAKLEARP